MYGPAGTKQGYTGICAATRRAAETMPTNTTDSTQNETVKAGQDEAAPGAQQQEHETALESLASICSMLAVFLFVTTFIFQNFEIPTGSMEQTLLVGDHVLVDRISLAPPALWAPFVHYREVRRGDIIVFLKPNPETPDLFLVKRAIGIPGDRIHLRHGIVFLNGVAQNEPYAGMPDDSMHPYSPYRDDFPSIQPSYGDEVTASWAVELPSRIVDGDLVVPPGKVFAMGDNRTESLDGRFWGFVPRENIVGRPMFVYWSFETPTDQVDKQGIGDRMGFMGHIVLHFFDQTRWKRTFHLIR
jgi:signal peptidase I